MPAGYSTLEKQRKSMVTRSSVACGKVLSETALEDLKVSSALLERLAGRAPGRRDWRELWPGR